MRRDRIAKLDAAMDAAGVDTLVLCGQQNVSYATGHASARGRSRARVVVALGRGARARARPGRTSTPTFPKARPPSCPTSSCTARSRSRPRQARRSSSASSAAGGWRSTTRRSRCGSALHGARARRRGRGDGPGEDHEDARRARVHPPSAGDQRSGDARRATAGGTGARCATELSGAFLRAVAELGATANTVDPVFQVMPRRSPTVRTASPASPSSRFRSARTSCSSGDVMWIDTGINLHGYASDFGATWIVGDGTERPSARPVRAVAQRSSTARWRG